MNRLRAIDWPRVARTGQRFLMAVGVITLGGWLPAQSWLIALGALTMFVPMFYLLYLTERATDGSKKMAGSSDPN